MHGQWFPELVHRRDLPGGHYMLLEEFRPGTDGAEAEDREDGGSCCTHGNLCACQAPGECCASKDGLRQVVDDTHDPRSDGDYVAGVPQKSCASQDAVPNVQDELADDNSSIEISMPRKSRRQLRQNLICWLDEHKDDLVGSNDSELV